MTGEKANAKTVEDDNIGIHDNDVAMMLDLNCATVYSKLKGWVFHNQNNEQNLRDGRYWTFNSMRAWSLELPFLSESQIRYALEKLEGAGLIVTGSYNKQPYDRTKWYSVNPVPRTNKPIKTEDSMPENPQSHLRNFSNGEAKIPEPIPMINTISNTKIKRLKDTPATKVAGGNGHKEMVSALEATTGMDMKIKTNAGRIVKVAKELRDAGYSFQNVNQFGELWKSDWRYKQNKTPPTLAIIKAEIGRTKNSATPKENRADKFREKYKEQG